MVKKENIQAIVQAVLDEIDKQHNNDNSNQNRTKPVATDKDKTFNIDLPDPTVQEFRHVSGIDHPIDPEGLQALMTTTPYRIGTGRAGPRSEERRVGKECRSRWSPYH